MVYCPRLYDGKRGSVLYSAVFNLCHFGDETKNIKPKEELVEEKNSKMVIDSESPNGKSESENGKRTVQRHYGQILALPSMRRSGLWIKGSGLN